MKQLYITLIDILQKIPVIRWVDFDTEQLQQEMPPLVFPAILVNINSLRSRDIGDNIQRVNCSFTLTLIDQIAGETNANAPEPMRSNALNFLDLAEKIYTKLQGFEDKEFYPFARTETRFRTLRGLNVVDMSFETAFDDYTATT